MKKQKTVKIKIERQGAPLVHTDNAVVEVKAKNIVAICVDLRSKYCEVDCLSTSRDDRHEAILIGATADSTNLKKNVPTDEDTKIYFPEYKGWKIFCCSLTRYTLRVCLIKKNKMK